MKVFGNFQESSDSLSPDRVPFSIIVLLPVEDFFLFAYRQPDPAFGHVQSEVSAPPSGSSEEQQALSGSSPDVQGNVRPAMKNKGNKSYHLASVNHTGSLSACRVRLTWAAEPAEEG